MSILIKTMTNLPEHCYDCPCHDGESGYCKADKEHRYSDYRPFWCPLVKTESMDYVHIVTYYDKSETEPVVTVFSNQDAAKQCYRIFKDLHDVVSIDCAPVYKSFAVEGGIMKNYKITVTDTATYIIRADSLEYAENLAVEWFDKREPVINSQETDEEAEYIIAKE